MSVESGGACEARSRPLPTLRISQLNTSLDEVLLVVLRVQQLPAQLGARLRAGRVQRWVRQPADQGDESDDGRRHEAVIPACCISSTS